MKEIVLQEFSQLSEATEFLEYTLWERELETDQLDGEIKLINGKWRVGVIINGRQKEFDFDDCG